MGLCCEKLAVNIYFPVGLANCNSYVSILPLNFQRNLGKRGRDI
jgi:hypothetical protein